MGVDDPVSSRHPPLGRGDETLSLAKLGKPERKRITGQFSQRPKMRWNHAARLAAIFVSASPSKTAK
jgi:hypothetical protein